MSLPRIKIKVGKNSASATLSRERTITGEGEIWVELVGELVVARVRGTPTEGLLREAQEKVLFLVRDAGRGKVLYDTLEMEAPPVDVPWPQRALDEQLGTIRLKREIVVPNSRLAYLSRIAFGEGDYRVF
jgi:hypothetical protein